MSTRVVHKFVGYETDTDRMVVSYVVPIGRLGRAKEIAGVTPDDPDAFMSYLLDLGQASAIADLAGVELPKERLEYFLEAFADRKAAAKSA